MLIMQVFQVTGGHSFEIVDRLITFLTGPDNPVEKPEDDYLFVRIKDNYTLTRIADNFSFERL
jgi:hypothetical protein